jgi:DNA sulfur modification protein DndE
MMINRLKTSKESKERLENLNRVLRMSSNAVILKYAISRSLSEESDVSLDITAQITNNSGFEISRSTLYGEDEIIYKLLMGVTKDDSDEKFFPQLTNMHIERGLRLLERDYKFAGNKEKFIFNIIKDVE